MLEVRLLGRFEIKHGQKTVSIASRPAQSLFAFLILNAGTAYRREKLAGQLWPDSTEESARDYLRHALWRIRKALQPISASSCIQANDLTVLFNAPSKYWLDTDVLQKADETGPIDQLAEALSAYSDDLLPGFYDEWVVLERERPQAVYERKVGCLLGLLDQAGRWPEVLEWSEQWIALGQKPESAFRHLMSAYAAQGDMAKTAAAYERCVKSLAEYGVEPSQETRSLYEDLKAGKRPAKAQPKPAEPRQTIRASWNVPGPLTSFVGREKEIADVVLLLQENRLVTLTGPGGVGKTRLAIQVANKMRTKFKNGVCWVELAPLADPDLVPRAVAGSLQVKESPGQSLIQALANHLVSKQLMLMLDNCEHLVVACAQISASLVAACPKVTVLATSREALRVPSERVYEVPSLSVPKSKQLTIVDLLLEYSSVRLFVERARAVKPDFELTELNADAVYQICQQLDGIPLALELAAARTKLLTVHQIAARLNDRFNLLTSGSRTALPRQQTLRATIDWSYDLLSKEERVLLRRLSAFSGGFTLGAVEAICAGRDIDRGRVLDLLGHLVDKSLVLVDRVVWTGDTRYGILETLREYLADRLQECQEDAAIRGEHVGYFAQWLATAEPFLSGPEQDLWLRRVELEIDNLRRTLEWSSDQIAGDTLAATPAAVAREHVRQQVHLCKRLGYVLHGQARYGECIDIYTRMRQTAETGGDLLGQCWALQGVAQSLAEQGNHHKAIEFASQAEAVARGINARAELVKALRTQGEARFRLGEVDQALVLGEECLKMAEELGDQLEMALALNLVGATNCWSGRYDTAEEYWLRALSVFRELGNSRYSTIVLNNLGVIAESIGDFGRAVQRYHDAWRSARDLGYRDGEIIYLSNKGIAQVLLGRFAQAEDDLRNAIQHAADAGSWMMPNMYIYLALALLGQGLMDDALIQGLHALKLAQDSDTPEYIGVAWRVLALVSEKTGKGISIETIESRERGSYVPEDCFRKSDQILSAAQLKVEQARTLRDWASYEIRSGHEVQGREMWNGARAIFEEIGARLEVERMNAHPE